MSEDELEEVHEEPSLDQLSQAFAEAMGRSQAAPPQEDSPTPADQDDSSSVAEDANEELDSQSDPDDSCPISPKSIFEAVLFVGHPENRPIAGKAIASLIRGVDEDELPALMNELNQGYLEQEMPYEVATELLVEPEAEEAPESDARTESVSESESQAETNSDAETLEGLASDNGDSEPKKAVPKSKKKRSKAKQGVVGYRLKLRDEFDYLRENFYGRVREAQLSQLAIDVLAVVAYNQPITREDINRLLDSGLDTGRVINQLVRRDLLSRQSNKDAGKSRTREYVTTDRFLQFFNLESVADLPKTDAPESLR